MLGGLPSYIQAPQLNTTRPITMKMIIQRSLQVLLQILPLVDDLHCQLNESEPLAFGTFYPLSLILPNVGQCGRMWMDAPTCSCGARQSLFKIVIDLDRLHWSLMDLKGYLQEEMDGAFAYALVFRFCRKVQ